MTIEKFTILCIIALLAACSKEPEMSDKEKDEKIILSITEKSARSLAKELAVTHPKNSENFYFDKIVAIVKDCTKKAELTACINSEVERLKLRSL
jgi:hypothetical protein